MTQNKTLQGKTVQVYEGLELGDLKRLVHPELHIDEFKSKLTALDAS